MVYYKRSEMISTSLKYYLYFLWLILVTACSSEKSSEIDYFKLKNSSDLCDYLDFAYRNQNDKYCDSACMRMSEMIKTQTYDFIKLESISDSTSGDINMIFKGIRLSEPYVPFKFNNSLAIQINSVPSLIIRDKRIEIENILQITKDFLINPKNDPTLSDKRTIEVGQIGSVEKPVGYVIIHVDSLQNNPIKSDWIYLFKTIYQIQLMYHQIWNEFSKARWNINFKDLDFVKKSEILEIYPYQIELHFNKLDNDFKPPTEVDLKDIRIIDD